MVHGAGNIPLPLSACANSANQAFYLLSLLGLGTGLDTYIIFIAASPLIRAVGSSPGVGRLRDESSDAGQGSEVEARGGDIDHETFRAKRGKIFSP